LDNVKYIERCLQIAKLGLGKVKSNPMVGAVLVYENRIIGEGYHQKFGEGHAEVNCFNSVKYDDASLIKDATLYVNLEPCSHSGKTPPCVDLVLSKKVKKVVLASIDMAKHVDGKSIQKLKQAGVDVEVGFLDQKNKWFFCPIGQEQKWISNAYSKKIVHKWRSEEQAILVGRNTFKIDKPQLNNRKWIGDAPIIVLIDKKGDLDLTHLRPKSTVIIFNSTKNLIEEKITYIKIDFSKEIFAQMFKILHQLEIASIFIEGGLITLNHILKNNLWDEARIITGAIEWEHGRKAPVFENYHLVEEKDFEEIKEKIITIAKRIERHENLLPEIYNRMLDKSIDKRWRYAYLFDNINDLKPELVKAYLPKIIKQLPKLTHHGLRRHFVRIIHKHPIPDNEELQNILVDQCFGFLQDAKIKVAVKAHCISICTKLCEIYPELKGEFCSILEEEMEKNSSAYIVRAREVLKKFS